MAEIRINRAAFLALWAKVVAQRLGFSEPEALTLGKAITGLTAQAKGRRLGIYEPRPAVQRAKVAARREERGVEWLEFMGRMVPVLRTEQASGQSVAPHPSTPKAPAAISSQNSKRTYLSSRGN